MSLPVAVATSGPEPVGPRPARVAVVAAVLAAIYLFAYHVDHRVPARFASLLGLPGDGIARYGGVRMRWRPPAGADRAAIAQAFVTDDGHRATVRDDGDALVIEVAGVRQAEAEDVARKLAAGPLELHEVVETAEMAALPDRLGLGPSGTTWEIDLWRPEVGEVEHRDTYLRGWSRAELDARFAEARRGGWSLPAGTHVAYQRVEPVAGEQDPRPYWRSYVVADAVGLDGSEITNASQQYSQVTDRPTVIMELDDGGRDRFADLTDRIVGRKLAIVIGNEVISAPTINSRIAGGRAEITMGGRAPDVAEREAEELAATLRAGPLPRGGELVEASYVAGSDAGGLGWLLRAAYALLAGALVGGAAWLVVRIARPVPVEALPPPGRAPTLRRVMWTLAGCAVLALGTAVTLPGVNRVEFAYVVVKAGPHLPDLTAVSILALGVAPILAAFIAVELVAFAVPPLRALRETPEGRARLGVAVGAVAIALAAVQAWFVASYLQRMSAAGADIVDARAVTRWLIVASLVGGVAVVVWVASLIERRGVGNGYAVVIVAGWLLRTLRAHPLGGLTHAQLALAAATVVVATVTIAAMLRWRVRAPVGVSLRLPTSGVAAVSWGLGVVALAAAVDSVGLVAAAAKLRADAATVSELGLVAVAVAAVAWSWLNARPRLRAAQLARAGAAAADVQTWLRATLIGAALLVAVFAVARASHGVAAFVALPFDGVALVFAVATLLDISDELRARSRGELVAVWPLASPLLADAVRDKLAAEGIAAHLRGVHVATALWWLGPFARVVVQAAPADAARAAQVVRAIVVGEPAATASAS